MSNYYELKSDVDCDKRFKRSEKYIYPLESNTKEIKFEDPGLCEFSYFIYHKYEHIDFPEVIFYYDAKKGGRENDFLLNIHSWPIVHKRVKDVFIENDIKGIRYYPVKLIEKSTLAVNENYYLMYVESFIDAFDMERSEYKYDEKYDYFSFMPMTTYINKKNCEGYDIFRPDKSTVHLFISERVKKIIDDNGFIGFGFNEYNFNYVG